MGKGYNRRRNLESEFYERIGYTNCQLRQVIGQVHKSKGERRKAINRFETVLGIASPFDWHDILCWTHYFLAELSRDENEFDDAHAHIEQAKSHSVGEAYKLGRATHLQATVWYR